MENPTTNDSALKDPDRYARSNQAPMLTKAMQEYDIEAFTNLLDRESSDSIKSEVLKELVHFVCSEARREGKPHPSGLQIARLLLEAGAVPDRTALIDATSAGVCDLVEMIVHHCKEIEPNYERNNRSALMIAAECGRADVLELLLSIKAICPHQMSQTRDTALSLALEKGHLECQKLLLQKGGWLPSLEEMIKKIDINCQNEALKLLYCYRKEQVHCLWFDAVSHSCDISLVNCLLEAGFDIETKDNSGSTALHNAVFFYDGDPALIDCLLKAGADIHARDDCGFTVLHTAVYCDMHDPVLVDRLLNAGADIQVKDYHGKTAFHTAVESFTGPEDDNLEYVNCLLKACADVGQLNSRTLEGDTALMLAAKHWNDGLITPILASGADVHATKHEYGKVVTVLSILLDSNRCRRYSLSIEELIEAGGLASLPRRCHISLFEMILDDKRRAVQLMVTKGMFPFCVNVRNLDFLETDAFSGLRGTLVYSTLSPITAAFVSGQNYVARYLLGNCFLTRADLVGSPQMKELKLFLQTDGKKESLKLLDTYLSKPMSLRQLAFVTVSDSLGEMDDREARLKKTGLPPYWQDRLMYRLETVSMEFFNDSSSGYSPNSGTE